MVDTKENNDEELVLDTEQPVQEKTKEKVNRREKIDKLLSKADIKYRGPFTYRMVRAVGFVLMLFAQIYLAYTLANKLIDVKESTLKTAGVLYDMSFFALPMFLAANFCIIMSSKNKIKKYFITYSITAIVIYLLVVLIYYRYMYGAMYAIVSDKQMALWMADAVANKLFGGMLNYNVFIDLALFAMFFLFLFYTPRKQMSRKGYLAFRWCSVIPVVLSIIAFVLYGLHGMGEIDLPMWVLALLPCRSLTVYLMLFAISLVMKWRKRTFIRWGGTADEYEAYLGTNRNSLEASVLASIVVFAVCLLDFALLWIDPLLIFFGLGVSWYFAAVIPFIFLLSYTRKPKSPVLDYALPVLFIFSCVIVYLEMLLYVVKSIFVY